MPHLDVLPVLLPFISTPPLHDICKRVYSEPLHLHPFIGSQPRRPFRDRIGIMMINPTGYQTKAVGKDELGSAHQVMVAMTKTAKALRIYLPNNPVLIGFIGDLHSKLSAHQHSYGEFTLDVEPFVLRYKGSDIYENPDPKESFASRVYADGIRTLFFDEGVDARELTAFLGIVGFEHTTGDDDVVTQLWERDIPHIRYLLEDDFIEAHLEEDLSPTGSQQEGIARVYRALAEGIPPQPKMIPKHLLMLTGEEEKWLFKARQVEARRNALDDVINILAAILAGVKDEAIFWDFVGIMGNLTTNMFLAGEVGHALRLVRFMDQLEKLPSTHPKQRRMLADTIGGILNDATVPVLQETLDTGESVSPEELKELLHIFGLRSLGAICELLGSVEKLKVRKVIVEVLVELGRENPAVFAPYLKDPRWYLVRNVVLVLSLLDTPVALDMILGLISDKEPRIRREVLSCLERSGDPRAKSYLVRFLRDDSSALRIKALQVLGREKLRPALKPVLALAKSDDFDQKEFAEKKAVYETLGDLGGDELLPMFREMLLKRYWFQKASEKEAAQLVAAALARVSPTEGIKLLEEALSQKRSVEVRAVLEHTLATLAAAKGRKGA